MGLDFSTSTILLVGVTLIAALYSSIGHAGASGYIALMSLVGLFPSEIRPAALVLNLLVASIGSIQFARAGHFSWRHFWPWAVLSVPAAFWGSTIQLPLHVIRPLLGAVLLFSAWRLISPQFTHHFLKLKINTPSIFLSLPLGALIGLLSGLTGTGGGIFLTPLLLFCHWATAPAAAAISVVFIWVNSVAGLIGHFSAEGRVPSFTWPLTLSAVIGGLIGSFSGSRYFSGRTIYRLLAFVLLIAGGKLMLNR